MSFDPSWYKNRNLVINPFGFTDQRRCGAESSNISSMSSGFAFDRLFYSGFDDGGTTDGTYTLQQVDAATKGAVTAQTKMCAAKIKLTAASTGTEVSSFGSYNYKVEGPNAAILASFPYTYIRFRHNFNFTGTASFAFQTPTTTNKESWVEEFTSTSGTDGLVEAMIPMTFNPANISYSPGTAGFQLRINNNKSTSSTTSSLKQWLTSATAYVGSSNQTNQFFRSSVNSTGYIWDLVIAPTTSNVIPKYIIQPSRAEDLLGCMRFYEKSYDVGVVPGTVTNVGRIYRSNGTAGQWLIQDCLYKVPKAVAGTPVVYDSAGNINRITAVAAGSVETNNITAGPSSQGLNGFQVVYNMASTYAGIAFHYTVDSEI